MFVKMLFKCSLVRRKNKTSSFSSKKLILLSIHCVMDSHHYCGQTDFPWFMSLFSSRHLRVRLCTSTLASQWKPHHAISSPHRFLWLQNSNRSVTTHRPLFLLNHVSPFPCSYNLILVLFLRFNRMQPPPLLRVAGRISSSSQLAPTAVTR